MQEFLTENMWVIWLVVAVAAVIVELCTTALVSIWFVPGAITSALLSMVVDNITLQIIVFLALSGVVLFLSKKIFRRNRPDQMTNANELLIGKVVVVKSPITQAEGKVLVGDVYWRAVADTPIEEGEYVTVDAVQGTVLHVTKS